MAEAEARPQFSASAARDIVRLAARVEHYAEEAVKDDATQAYGLKMADIALGTTSEMLRLIPAITPSLGESLPALDTVSASPSINEGEIGMDLSDKAKFQEMHDREEAEKEARIQQIMQERGIDHAAALDVLNGSDEQHLKAQRIMELRGLSLEQAEAIVRQQEQNPQ